MSSTGGPGRGRVTGVASPYMGGTGVVAAHGRNTGMHTQKRHPRMQRLKDRAQDPPLWTLIPNKVSLSVCLSLSCSLSLSLSLSLAVSVWMMHA